MSECEHSMTRENYFDDNFVNHQACIRVVGQLGRVKLSDVYMNGWVDVILPNKKAALKEMISISVF